VSVERESAGVTMGTVSFGGITKEICLVCVPDVEVGDHVIVHAGFAISKIDEREAGEVFRMLEEIAEISGAESSAWDDESRNSPAARSDD
jgi:hydrogenase expression/formation protein HypC